MKALRTSKWNLCLYLLFASGLFFGIETGIRSVVAQPYVINLFGGDVIYLAYFQSVLSVSRLLGIFAYKFKFIHYEKGALFAFVSLILFAFAELVGWKTKTPTVFLIFYSLAVFSMGWYFPIRRTVLTSFIVNPKHRATIFSLDNMVLELGSGLTCLVLGYSITHVKQDIQGYWIYGAIALLISAALFFQSTCRTHEARGDTDSDK